METENPEIAHTPQSLAVPSWTEIRVIPLWNPKARGERITGKFVMLQTLTGQYGPYPSVVIETEKTRLRVSGTTIGDLFASTDINPGQLVKLVYTGMKETSSGFLMKTFRLFKQEPQSGE